MDLGTFLQQRRPEWRRLEEMLRQVEGSGLRSLSDEQAIEFGRLYRRAASDLNQAQTFVSGDEVVAYLNQLVARGYTVVYGGGPRLNLFGLTRAAFFGYAGVLRKHFVAFLIATGIFFFGAVLGLVLSLYDASFIEYVVPAEFAHITPEEAGEQSRSMTPDEIAGFSGFLFVNNVMASLLAFALGLTLGVGTCWVLLYNGLLMGAIGALFWRAEQMVRLCAELLPHGVLELPAIFIGGAAGLVVARAMIVARPWSRLEEMARAGKEAIWLVSGVVPLLAAAAVLEAGVARAPSWLLGDWLKLTVAGAVGLLFAAYIAFVGRASGVRNQEPGVRT